MESSQQQHSNNTELKKQLEQQLMQQTNKNRVLNQLKSISGNRPGLPSQTMSEGIYNGIRTNLPTREKVNAEVTGASKKVSDAAANFGKTMNTILDSIVEVYGNDRNIIFSVISTIMDAVNNSVMGGLTGLESELQKIVNEEKGNSSGKPNAGLDFLADCANFIRFFLEYLYYNKKLKIQKHNNEKAEKSAAENKNNNVADHKKALQSKVVGTDEDSEETKRIDYLNKAFYHLVFTYGQLSGRTIYNIIQFLKNGPPQKVGYFDPISFGSLGSSIIRSTPMGSIAGQIMDSVVDFCKAFINAGEASYVSLQDERELANDYMAYITDDTKETIRKETIRNQKGGADGDDDGVNKIDKKTFEAYYKSVKRDKGDKGDKKSKVKNYKERIGKLSGNKGRTNTNHNISQLTAANIEKRIKDVTNAMAELNHVDNLKALLELILEKGKYTQKKKSIYIDSNFVNKDKSKIPLLIQGEVKEMRLNPQVKLVFGKIIKKFDTMIKPPTSLNIKKSNPELYGIIMNFIRNNYKSDAGQNDEINNRLVGLLISMEENNIVDHRDDVKQTSNGQDPKEPTPGAAINATDNHRQRIAREYDKYVEIILEDPSTNATNNNLITPTHDGSSAKNSTAPANGTAAQGGGGGGDGSNIEKEIKDLEDLEDTIKNESRKNENEPTEGKAFLQKEYTLLLDQLNNVKKNERGKLNDDIHNSGNFGKLASTYVKLKTEMAADINGLINNVTAVGIKEKELKNLEKVKSGLKKMLRFISNREFGSINALFKRQKGGGNKTRRGGGDLSNIRRHIAKATRRIETTLNNFNNTRRNKRIKPRKTRRVNYGH